MLCVPWVTSAQETVTIGEGTETTYVTPFNSLWGYSFVEQIYLASEIGTDGNITAVRFYLSSGTQTNDITLYMKNVTRSTFSSSTDYEPVSASDIVFTGSVTFASGWVEILLDQPFEYDGSSNLLVAMHEYTPGYSTLYFNYTAAADRVITFHSDSANPDPYNLGSYSGNGYTSPNRANIQLDIEPAGEVSCYPVKNLAIVDSLTTTESLTLTWIDTNNTGATYIVYTIAGTDTTEVDAANINITGTTAVITGLNANTHYTFGVKADCGNGDVTAMRTVIGRTACGAITEFPWTEDFETYASGISAIPCWVNEHIEGGGSQLFKIYTSSTGGNSTHMLQLPDQTGGTLTKLVLPYMLLPEDSNYMFTLDIYRSNSTYNSNSPLEGIRIYVSTDGNLDGATELGFISRQYNSASELAPAEETANAWYSYEIPLGIHGNCYIILRGESQYCTSTYMDNFSVKAMRNCQKPTNLAVSNVAGHTAELNWSGEADSYVVEYRKTNGTEWFTAEADDTTFTLTELRPTTGYTVQIVAVCGEEYSYPSRTATFTTAVACPAPTSLKVTALATEATVTWHDPAAAAWELKLITPNQNPSPEDTVIFEEISDTTFFLEGLEPETQYKVCVRTVCGGDDGESVWSSEKSFTTPATCQPPIDLRYVGTMGDGTVATITWVDTLASQWEIVLMNVTDTLDTDGEHSYFFDGLTEEQSYTVKVRAICGEGENDISQWATLTFAPSAKTVIGTAAGTNASLPTHSNWRYSLTQQIYTATELNEAGMISAVDFRNAGSAKTRNINVYVVNTDKNSFANDGDWIEASEADKVFGGSVTFTANAWTTIEFDNPFYYLGESNIAIIVEDITGSYSSGLSCNTFTTTGVNQAIYSYNDNSPYSVTAPVKISNGGVTTSKNFIRLLKTEMPSCFPVRGLTTTEVNAYEATVSWDATEAGLYMVEYKGATDEEWEPVMNEPTNETFANIFDLDPQTTYQVRVKAICGDEDESDWSSVLEFTTPPACLVPTDLRAEKDEEDFSFVTMKWDGNVASAWEYRYWGSWEDTLAAESDIVYDSILEIEGLEPDSIYYVQVRTDCEDQGFSDWTPVYVLHTDVACHEVYNVNVILTPGNGSVATVTWGDSLGYQWDIELKHGEEESEYYSTNDENPDSSYAFDNLEAETAYSVRVRSNCEDYVSRWSEWVTFVPTNAYSITINDGTTTNSYVPIYGFYVDNHIKSQFIIPAESLTDVQFGNITELTFYSSNDNKPWNGASFEVYMTETEATTVSSLSDVETMTQVYTGHLSIENYEMVVTMDQPFNYMGGNLMIAFEQPTSGSYSSCSWFGVTATGASMGGYGTSVNQQNFLPKMTIAYTPGEAPECELPTNLEFSDLTGHEVNLSWEGDVDNTFIMYKKATASDWTEVAVDDMPFTLEGLDQNTTYNARVKLICNEVDEYFSNTVTFTTEMTCVDPTGTIEVTLTEGDGSVATVAWNITNAETAGAPLQLVLLLGEVIVESSEVEATGTHLFEGLTPEQYYTVGVRYICDADNNDYSGYKDATFRPTNSIPYTVNDGTNTNGVVPIYGYWCDNSTKSQFIIPATSLEEVQYGTIYKLIFYASNANVNWGNASFKVYMSETDETTVSSFNIDGMNQVYSGSLSIAGNQMAVEFDTPFEYNDGNLMIAFNQTASGSYVTCSWYGVTATGASIGGYGTSINQQNFLPKTTFIYVPGEPPTCPKPKDLAAETIGKHSATLSWTEKGEAEMWQIRVNGDDEWIVDAPENPFTLEGLEIETEYTVEVRAYCDEEDQSEWSNAISFTTDIACPAVTNVEVIPGPTVAIFNWSDASSEEGTLYNIYMMEDGLPTIAAEGLTLAALPYTVEGLEPETPYVFGVQAVCTEGEADTVFVEFTTDVNCPTPYGLTADEESITASEATIEWTGFSEGYNVRYRPAAPSGEGINESFENGMGDWTTIDADGDGYDWVLGSACGGIYLADGGSLTNGHTGSDMIVSGSYSNATNSALTPDNYLISPMVNLGGSISFWAQAQDSSYAAEHLGVAVSTTSNTDATAFTTIQEWTMSATGATPGAKDQGTWVQLTADLSDYAGQTGYVAIRHFNCTDMFILNIDDITIVEPNTEAPEEPWIPATAETTNITLSGLNSATTYEVQVQASCDEENWSETLHFTTIPSCLALEELEVVEEMTTSSSVTLSWVNPNEGEGTIVVTDQDGNVLTTTETETGCTITGLEANTAYTFHVRLFCSDEDSSAAVSVRTRTSCAPISELPYVENFGGDGINCWSLTNIFQISGYGIDGSACIYANPGDSMYAILPVMEANISDLALSFSTANYNINYNAGILYVGYVNADGDTASFVAVDSVVMADYDTYNDYMETPTFLFTGAPEGSRMAIRSIGNGASFIDSVIVIEKPACMAPYALTYDNVENHSVELSWIEQGEATAWQIMVNGDEEFIVDATTNPFVLTGLAADSTQFVQVRANCGAEDGVSEWSGAVYFTTLIACPAPTIATITPGVDNAIVEWSAIGEGVTYTIYSYSEDGEPEVLETGITATTYTFTGLDAQTTYTYGISADCSISNDGVSLINEFNFTTLCSVIELPYVNDDFEDFSCWTKQGNGTWQVGVGDYAAATGSYSGDANLLIKHGTTNTVTKIITPVINGGEYGVNLQFAHIQRSWAGDYDYLKVYYRSSADGAWQNVAQYTSAVASWTLESIDIEDNVYQIAFEHTDKYGYGLGIDSVAITALEAPETHTVTVTAMPADGGTVNGIDGEPVVSPMTIADGEPLTLSATAAEGYEFFEWQIGNEVITDNPLNIEAVTADMDIVAVFTETPLENYYTVTVTYDAVMGTIIGIPDEAVEEGTSVTLMASPATCYNFVDWKVNGQTVSEEANYTFTVNEDVNLEATFVAVENYAEPIDITACDSYEWNGEIYTTSDTYTAETVNVEGCVLIETLNLTINYSNTGVDVQTACDEFEWIDGNVYTESNNEAQYTLTNAAGCDSVVTLNLTVNYSNSENVVETINENDLPYTFMNNDYVAPVVSEAIEAGLNVDGCDSTVIFTLIVNMNGQINDFRTICDNELPYTWNDVEFTEAGMQSVTLEDIYGADSVVNMYLTVNYGTHTTETVVACNEYIWRGETYTESDTYVYDYTNVDGCASDSTLNLTIKNSTIGVDVQTACDTYTWIDGIEYTASNNEATFTMENAAGCDSVITLNLTINNSNTGVDVQTACDSYTWINGETYTASNNEATFTLTNAAGCDSVVTLNLTINNSNTGVDVQTACDSYTWIDGIEYTANNNEATFTLTNAAGCDSVVTLNLTINNSVSETLDITAMDSYTFNGIVFTEDTTYVYTGTTVNGCDSIVTLHLTITHNTDIVVILTVNDATMGTTNPVAGTYVFSAGDVVTATATANEGYEFVGWVASMGIISDTVSREATVTYELLPMMQGMTINVEAVFQAAQVPPTTYTVTVNYDATMGTVTSVPETLTGLAAGTEVTLTATALEGYEFTNWTDATGTALNATNPYTFTVTENVTINANFQAVVVPPTYYTVNISVNPAEAGIVNGMPDSNAVVAGTELHLTAVPANNGYVFVNWTVNNTTVEGATLDTVVNADMTIVANFEATVPQTYYTVNISVNPAEAGIVNGVPSSSSVVAGTELHLTAIPANNGYVFVNWTVNNTTVEGATLDTVVNADMTIVANFENSIVPPTYYTVNVNYDATMGTVEGIPTTQTVAEGTQLTLTATALEGYEFVNWTVNGQTVEGATYTTTVNADLTIIANFQAVVVPPTYYTVTVNYDETMGTVEGIPTEAVEAGSDVTLTATAKTNYRFVGWLIGEDTVSHEATYTIEDIQSDVTISAVFVSTIGINDVDMSNVSIYSANSTIYVKGAEGQTIHIYDLNGRTVVTKTNAAETMAIPMDETGVYLVRVGNAAAKRVMLMR